MIMGSGIEHEFRTTIVKSILKGSDLEKIGALIKGSQLYVLQKFVPSKPLDTTFLSEATYSDEDFEALKEKLKDYVQNVVVR